jgi:hypothetical protein
MRKPLIFLFIVLIIGCSEEDDQSFQLKSIDIAGAQTLFTTVYGSYNTDTKRYLMQDLYMIDTDKSIRKVEMSFNGDLDDTKRFNVFDVNDQYFIISFYELKQTYFVEKANGEAHASAYFMPSDLRPDFAFDGAGNFYVKSEDGAVLKISNPLSRQANIESITLNDAYTFLVDNSGKIVFHQLYDIYLRSNDAEVKLFDTFNGFWCGPDGNVKIVDETGTIFRVEGEGIEQDGAPLTALDNDFVQLVHNFPELNKSAGIGSPKNGRFNFYELSPQQELRLAIPCHEDNFSKFNYEADRYSEYYFLVHGNTDGPLYLQKINVNTFEISERKINTTHTFHGIHAVNADMVLFGLCIPNTDNVGCSPQFAYLDDTGEIKFLMADKQWFYTFIGL